MKQVLWDLIGEHPGRQLHNAVVFIGNDRTGIWEDAAGLSSTESLVEIIDRVAGPPERDCAQLDDGARAAPCRQLSGEATKQAPPGSAQP